MYFLSTDTFRSSKCNIIVDCFLFMILFAMHLLYLFNFNLHSITVFDDSLQIVDDACNVQKCLFNLFILMYLGYNLGYSFKISSDVVHSNTICISSYGSACI